MDPGEIEALIECLVANPHDADALARAHRRGESDPQGYAYLLEQVGTRTEDAAYASHWLSEAANIWSITLGDAHRAARVLMIAVDRDPTQPLAADRLAQLYREKGDLKALVAMLDRRVRLLTPMLASNAEGLRGLLASLHEELGKAWSEPPLDQPRKAIDHFKRSIELDSSNPFPIFSLREIYKTLQQWDDAIALYGMEMAVERDPERRLLLARDEADARRHAGDAQGVTHVLRRALEEIRASGRDDAILAQEVAGSVLDRVDAGAPVDERERSYAADLLAALAEAYDGEHGLAYAAGALDLVPGHDRAMQLYAYHATGSTGGAGDALTLKYHAYLEANPNGPVSNDARVHLAAGYQALGQFAQAAQVLQPLEGRPEVSERLDLLSRQMQTNGVATPVVGVGEVPPRERPRVPPPPISAPADRDAPQPGDTEEVAEMALGPRPRTPAPAAKQVALEAARERAAKADKAGALERYLEVLTLDPVEPEALAWVEDALRAKRDYSKLRDVLWASARAMTAADPIESRKLRLREIAGLSESNLKDLDGAVLAWRQLVSLDRGDDAARQALTRALEKSQRWDDLATVYEQDASISADVDAKIQLEKKLAVLHEQKRSDPLAAAEAWSRIASLVPDDEQPLTQAVDLFLKAARHDLAAAAIEEHVEGVTAADAKAALLERLGGLLEANAGELASAGRAYQRAAEALPTLPRWASAERCFASAETWPLAATAAEKAAELTKGDSPSTAAEALSRSAGYRKRGGDIPLAIMLIEKAAALAPSVDAYPLALLEMYREAGNTDHVIELLVKRGASHADPAVRVASAREAAKMYEAAAIPDEESARSQWLKVLEGGEDKEALERLTHIAENRDELGAAAAYLERLCTLATTKEEKTDAAMREALLLARMPDQVGAAVQKYEWIVETLDPRNRKALRAIWDLEMGRDVPKAAAHALERELAVTESAADKREVAALLVQAYEAARDDKGTFDALTLLREADREDFDTLHRLVKLAEKLEKWDALDGLLGAQIESEADDAEIAVLSRRRARVLADKLDRGDEALALLQELADGGDAAARDEYVALGDKLGWKGIVATKLVDWWFPEPPSAERIAALTGALDRFRFVGRDRDAVKVGVEILRSSRDAKLASEVEALAVKTEDDIGLSAAQEVLGLEVSGLARATELVRQAETRVQAKMGWAESVQHGETGLVGIAHDDAMVLVARLAALIPTSNGIIDLYERQVSRSRGGEAREKALIVAAQVAGEHNDQKRARTFFDLALSGTPTEATLDAVASAPSGTGEKSDALRRTLAEAFAHGGGGVRDGGRSRANFLRRAARIAEEDLRDTDQAFAWLTEALIAHADTATLDALSALAEGIGAPKRMDAVLTHVLTEVFDGPLVRLLLARRAKIRKELLGDRTGAAADLKKLHDLSPTDEAVMAELSALLLEQGDHRSMVQLFEDQILRSKDQAVRAELARKVAQIWESELGDAREAADGWRRVLRLKPGDEEAAQGLDRAKSNMLRKGPVIVPAVVPQPVPSAPAHTESPETLASAKSTPSARPSGPPKLPPVVMAKQDSGQTPDLGTPAVVIDNDDSVEDVDDLDLEEEPLFGDHTKTERGPTVEEVASITSDLVGDIVESPQLEQLLGTTDPFAEADTTHTSIDVRIPMAAAVAMDRPSSRPPASVPPKVPSARASKPPPLPPLSSTGSLPSSGAHSSYQQNEPPTAPGRRLDTAYSHSPSERALAMTDENGPLDFAERTVADGSALEGLEHRHREPPADVLSATDLAMDDDDDDEVLVVDEFVGESDEYEDVVEPSKPPGPMPH